MPKLNEHPKTASVSKQPFDYVGLCSHDAFHVTYDTRPSHFSRAMLKSWGWSGVQG